MKSGGVPTPHVRFGPFEVDFETGEVRKHGLKLRLQEKPLRVLQALVEKPGKLVTREDLRNKLWPEDHYVDFDRNLTIAMNRLRTVLSDSADEPRYIETLPRRGYRFIYPLDGHDGHGLQAGAPSEGVPLESGGTLERPTPTPVVGQQVPTRALLRSRSWLAASLAVAAIIGVVLGLRFSKRGGKREPAPRIVPVTSRLLKNSS
jgi:DNA-binding winged helix-turn-helix (wHTH) protein